MKKYLILIVFMLVGLFLSIDNAYAAGGTIGGYGCNYEVNSINLEGDYVVIKGWLYTVEENELLNKAIGNSIEDLQAQLNQGKTHAYSIKIGGKYYFDTGSYHVDHTALMKVDGQKAHPYQNVGFYFKIPISDLINSGYNRLKIEVHFYQPGGKDYYKNLAYIAPQSSLDNDKYTLYLNSSGETATFYPNGVQTFVRSGPSKTSTPLKSELGYGSQYGYQLYFLRYNYYSYANGTYTGNRVLDENMCSWYQVRFVEHGLTSDGRARVEANANGRYGWLSGVFAEYASEDFTFRIVKKQSTYYFDANKGTGAPEPQLKYPGKDFQFPIKIPTLTGQKFLGWGWTKTGNALYMPNQIVSNLPDVDVTFYAIWQNTTPIIESPILPSVNDIPPFIQDGFVILQLGDLFEASQYAKAYDEEDGNLTSKIKVTTNTVPLNSHNKTIEAGKFLVTYEVEDSAGNKASASIQVLVNDPPTISASNRYFFVGEEISDDLLLKDVQGYDKEDGNITHLIKIKSNEVNSNYAGTYTVVYEVTDSYFKTMTKNIVVNITNNNYETKKRQLRYITSNYLNTLSNTSKWNKGHYRDILNSSLSKQNQDSIFIFKWTSQDNEIMKQVILNNGDFKSLYVRYQVK